MGTICIQFASLDYFCTYVCFVFCSHSFYNGLNRKREKGKGRKEQKTNGEPTSPVSEEPESVDRNLFGEDAVEPPSQGSSVSLSAALSICYLNNAFVEFFIF